MTRREVFPDTAEFDALVERVDYLIAEARDQARSLKEIRARSEALIVAGGVVLGETHSLLGRGKA